MQSGLKRQPLERPRTERRSSSMCRLAPPHLWSSATSGSTNITQRSIGPKSESWIGVLSVIPPVYSLLWLQPVTRPPSPAWTLRPLTKSRRNTMTYTRYLAKLKPFLCLHRPYDCAKALLPGTTFPSSHLFNLSKHESQAMETYIRDSPAKHNQTMLLTSGCLRRKTVLSVPVLISDV